MPPIVLATINAKWIHPSLALRLLKANLGEYEAHAEILEFALKDSLEKMSAAILEKKPLILGLSVAIWNHKATLALLKELSCHGDKAAAADSVEGAPVDAEAGAEQEARANLAKQARPIIVLGGPEASTLHPNAELFQYADYVVRGEGETVFRELCRLIFTGRTDAAQEVSPLHGEKPANSAAASAALAPSFAAFFPTASAPISPALPAAASVNGKFITANPVDLSAIDSGYRLYTQEDLDHKLTYVEASRGCPFGCHFCLSSVRLTPKSGNQVRAFPLPAFLRDMETLITRGAKSFKFLDRTFNLDPTRSRHILTFFLKYMKQQPSSDQPSPLPPAPAFVHFEITPSPFPAELRGLLARFPQGSLRLEVGIQTFNPETAALINRKSDPEKEMECLAWLMQNTSAIVHVDLIAGLPGEGLASFAKGFDALARLKPTEIQLGILKCLPGTPLADHAAELGIRFSPEPPYEIIETQALTAAELSRVKNFARFWELVVNRKAVPGIFAEGGGFSGTGPGNGAKSASFAEGNIGLPNESDLPDGYIFNKFMRLSDKLICFFGRNWGIDKKELQKAVLQLEF